MKVVQDHDKCEEYEKLLKLEYMSSESEAEYEDFGRGHFSLFLLFLKIFIQVHNRYITKMKVS